MIRVILSKVQPRGAFLLSTASWFVAAKPRLRQSVLEMSAVDGDGECTPSLYVAVLPLRLLRALSEVAVRVGRHQARPALGGACGDVEDGEMATWGGRDGA